MRGHRFKQPQQVALSLPAAEKLLGRFSDNMILFRFLCAFFLTLVSRKGHLIDGDETHVNQRISRVKDETILSLHFLGVICMWTICYDLSGLVLSFKTFLSLPVADLFGKKIVALSQDPAHARFGARYAGISVAVDGVSQIDDMISIRFSRYILMNAVFLGMCTCRLMC